MRSLSLLSLALLAALVLAACGQEAQDAESGGSQTEISYVAETEGIYIDLDGMKYQVQISRQLNPLIADDRAYLNNLLPATRTLRGDEVWFAVFMRVENEEKEPLERATEFEIRDTQENVYEPVAIGPGNVFAYEEGVNQPEELYPLPNSPAGERAPNGSLLLFKVRRFSLDNRPLELVLTGPESGRRTAINLDV